MIRELSARKAAQVVKDAFKSKGVTVTHTEALNLIAQLRGFNAWSHLKAATAEAESLITEAPSVSQGSVPNIAVTNLDGTAGVWAFENNLSDRWGELNWNDAEHKPSLKMLEAQPKLLDALNSELVNEVSFIVARDGRLGILIEVEYASRESEQNICNGDEAALSSYKPHAQVCGALLKGMRDLQEAFPMVEFCIPDSEEVFEGRPAAWAFVRHEALPRERLLALSNYMLDL